MRLNFKPGIVIHRKITWLLLFLLFSLAISSWLIYVTKTNFERTASRIDRTYEIMSRMQRILNSVSESYRYLSKEDREALPQLRKLHERFGSMQRVAISPHFGLGRMARRLSAL